MKVVAKTLAIYENNMERMATVGFSFCQLALVYALAVLVFTGMPMEQFMVSGLGNPHDKIIISLSFIAIPLTGQIFIAGLIGLMGILLEKTVSLVR